MSVTAPEIMNETQTFSAAGRSPSPNRTVPQDEKRPCGSWRSQGKLSQNEAVLDPGLVAMAATTMAETVTFEKVAAETASAETASTGTVISETETWRDGSVRIGIHTSIAGDIAGSLESARKLGCNALQI